MPQDLTIYKKGNINGMQKLPIGGRGAIASTLRQALLSDDACQQIWLFSRSQSPAGLSAKNRWQNIEYSYAVIKTALADCLLDSVLVQKGFICNGRINNANIKSEKRLEQFNAED